MKSKTAAVMLLPMLNSVVDKKSKVEYCCEI